MEDKIDFFDPKVEEQLRQMILREKKPKAAIYAFMRKGEDDLPVLLLRNLCLQKEWNPIIYIDRKRPKPNKPSDWKRLCDDVAKGMHYIVITYQDFPTLQEYCERYNTQFAVIDPFP